MSADLHLESGKLIVDLYQAINQISPIPKEIWGELPPSFFRTIHLSAGDFFTKQGKLATDCAFVATGLLKEYYLTEKGEEFIKSFNFPGEFTGSYFDLINTKPSTCSIRALSDCTLVVARFSEFYALFETHNSWQRFGRIIAEKLFSKKAEREYELLTLSAKERYLKLKEKHLLIENEISQINIASYLGITSVSLSRLRNQLKTEKLKQP